MKNTYHALIQGGEGPDVWDKEMKIDYASDISAALEIAVSHAERSGGHVVEISLNNWGNNIAGSTTAIKRTLQRLSDRVHSGYDFNKDPDRITLEVGQILGP